ncbi:SRPBCC domain-containing protein [Actinomycetota bacterium Odt1-20B]
MNAGDPPPAPTHVTLALRPGAEGGTSLSVVHRGFAADDATAVAWHERAWAGVLANLRTALADEPVQLRRS